MAKGRLRDQKQIALEAIRKKLVGKQLTYQEYYAVINEIVNDSLGETITAHFVAANFSQRLSNQELYFLTKAMIETGKKISFPGMVADKHSVGGIAGYRTTLVVVPIIAAAGLKIPKTSSRAITTPGATADVMEVLAEVRFSLREIEAIVKKVGGCIVWGGEMDLAPADNKIIKIEKALSFESYDSIVASVMAKKIAAGATHLVIDIPYGPEAKVKSLKYALFLERKIKYVARRFGLKVVVEKIAIDWPIGYGIGPLLEARDCLQVLEQKKDRPLALERRILRLTASLLELCGLDKRLACKLLISGAALKKFREIVAAQKGDPKIKSDNLQPGKFHQGVRSRQSGLVKKISNQKVKQLCCLLGAPEDKKAGLYLKKQKGKKVKKGEILFLMYSSDKMKLKEAEKKLQEGLRVYKID